MGRIFLKLLRTRYKEYLLVVLSGNFIISTIFFIAGVESCMIFISTREKAGMTSLIMESEKAFLLSYILLMILMILILLSYIRKRADDYSMLKVLGIQRKHKYMFIGLEYLGIVIGSLIGGILIGVLEVEIIKRALVHFFADNINNISYGWSPFILTFIISLLIFGIGFMICDQIISCLGIDCVISMGKKSNKKIQHSLRLMGTGAIVIMLALISVVTYWGRSGSIVPLALAAGGLFLIMISAGTFYLHKLRKWEQKYFKKVLWLNSWYDQFLYHVSVTYIAAVFVFVILFGFGLPVVDNVPVVQPEIFPYDMVWYANKEDMPFLNKLKGTYKAKIDTKPCVRVVSGDYGVYGEHMGISKTVYERWTGEKIDIQDKEIHIVYQRDRASMGTAGINYGNSKPRTYIGSAGWDIWNTAGPKILPGSQFAREYKIVGEEQKILTGGFESRAIGELKGQVYEEIFVFSDAEFENIKKNARGADLVVMMDIPAHYDQVANDVRKYAKIHSQVNFFDWKNDNLIYEKQKSIIDQQQEKMFKAVSMIIDIIALFICILFILFEKVQSDYSEMEWKYRFYKNCGMPLVKRKKTVRSEILISGKLASCSGILLGMLAVIVRILSKGLSSEWCIIYLSAEIFLSVIISLTVYIGMKITAHRVFQKIEGRK